MARFYGRRSNILVRGGGQLPGKAWMTGVLAGYEDAGAYVRGCVATHFRERGALHQRFAFPLTPSARKTRRSCAPTSSGRDSGAVM